MSKMFNTSWTNSIFRMVEAIYLGLTNVPWTKGATIGCVSFGLVVYGAPLVAKLRRIRVLKTERCRQVDYDTTADYKQHLPRSNCQCSECLKDEMRQNGWCPHQSDYWARSYGNRTLSHLASLRTLEEPHTHDGCDSQPFCSAYNVDMTNYKTRHICSSNACSTVEVPHQVLLDVLRGGDIPLISIGNICDPTQEGGVRLQLHVHRAQYPLLGWTKIRRYVAISHVWAHGLGNPQGNALPTCQVLALKTRLDNLSETLFWMDTLCIPVEPQHRQLKMQTIHNMASIYAMAHSVLILDLGLMSLDHTRYNRELLFLFMSCVWMRRSWTFQEGLLAHHWIIQFHDSALRLSPPHRSAQEAPWFSETLVAHRNGLQESGQYLVHADDPYIDIKHDLLAVLARGFICSKPYSAFYAPRAPSAAQLVSAWNALAGRSTSKSNDLHLILANALDIETDSLMEAKATEYKLERILLSCEELPLSLLFLTRHHPSQNLPSKNQWIPSRLSRELLLDMSTMRFDPGWKMFKLCEWGKTCDIYILRVATLRTQTCCIQLEGWPSMFAIELVHGHGLGQMTTDMVCLIVERKSFDAQDKGVCSKVDSCTRNHRGACLLLDDISTLHSTAILTLSFWCPIVLHPVAHIASQSLVRTSKVYQDTELWMKYDPIPGLSPLSLRAHKHERLQAMKFFFHFFEFMLWTAPSIVIAGFTFATTLYPYLFIANCLWFLAHLLYGYINRMARSIYKQRFESVRRAYQNRRTPSLRRRRQGLLTLVFVLSIFGSCLRIFEAMRPSHEVCLTARPEDETTTQLLVICIPRKDCFWVMQFCSSIVETGKIARHPTPEEVEHIRSHIRFEQEFWHVWEQLVVISWLANRTVPEEQAPLERHCLHLFYPDVYVQDISPDSLYPPTKWP